MYRVFISYSVIYFISKFLCCLASFCYYYFISCIICNYVVYGKYRRKQPIDIIIIIIIIVERNNKKKRRRRKKGKLLTVLLVQQEHTFSPSYVSCRSASFLHLTQIDRSLITIKMSQFLQDGGKECDGQTTVIVHFLDNSSKTVLADEQTTVEEVWRNFWAPSYL